MDIQETFVKNKAEFRDFYERVEKIHASIIDQGMSTQGHGFDHDLLVAQYGYLIAEAEDERVGELAWIAGLLHSFDRHFSPLQEKKLIDECLNLVGLSESDNLDVRVALNKHSERNDPSDSPVLVALKDADRLANIGAINLIRGGQHRPNIPACIPETVGSLHPSSTFRKPMSCYDATFYNLEWEAMLRLPRAKKIAEKYFNFIREFQTLVVEQFRETGLYPWPK